MQYTKKQLEGIIESHQHYLLRDCQNWINMRADLSRADLSGADLGEANLNRANLSGANLNRADLGEANLNRANLSGANLNRADLSGANLSGADLSGANLGEADLIEANLNRANLSGANLGEADLIEANLGEANLIGANLSGADLSGANLSGANLSEAERPRLGKILDEPLIGYKKSLEGKIITATIPAGAIVFSINNSKCRTNKARIIDMEGAELLHSRHDRKFTYRLLQDIDIKDFNLIYNIECASGFHFFKTRKEAEEY